MIRKPIFDAVRDAAPPGLFDDPGNIHALNNLLDAFSVPRASVVPKTTPLKINAPATFFDRVRLVTGKLSQQQVDSITLILAAGQHLPKGRMAYVLATAWHESRFKPQAEWGRGFGKPYGKKGRYGQAQYGRGYVQLTWDENYEWADKALGLGGELLKNFDKALEPGIAARILVKGMETGAFTGKKMADYIDAETPGYTQFVNARRIVNGTDKAATIATYAGKFLDALRFGDWR